MTNKEISRHLRSLAALMELHDENAFRIRSVQNASFQVDRAEHPLETLSETELLAIPGIGKSMASKIYMLCHEGIDTEWDEFAQRTPAGVIEMLNLKGIGPKKVRQLWNELEIESPGELLYACNENRLVSLKGFGVKTQENIKQALEFKQSNAGLLHYAEAEHIALKYIEALQLQLPELRIECSGELRRQNEIIREIKILSTPIDARSLDLGAYAYTIELHSDHWLVEDGEGHTIVHIQTELENFEREQWFQTGPESHCSVLDADPECQTEAEIYTQAGWPYIAPALRDWPEDTLKTWKTTEPIALSDFKGILHCHSNWSDGADTLEVMAQQCREMGMEYFGICDHSKSAFYANGLQPERVLAQHKEIDALNARMPGFRIFKGIESDILNDGSLDYDAELLSQFDLVVASVHSVLQMDEKRATERVIRAIENPYTTILGHPSGRLLLSRKGYPLDYLKVIDACAAHGVAIELNAHPYRLDIDWRWIPYCMDKGVQIAINPDAHRKEGLRDIRYGMLAAQKGGLTRAYLLNNRSCENFENYLKTRR